MQRGRATGIALLGIAAIAWPGSSCQRPPESHASEDGPAFVESGQQPGGLPPLVVDRDAPLLLDESDADLRLEEPETEGPAAANRACIVCHANFEEEELVQLHTPHGVNCVWCHGESFAHRNDEGNTTPPDVMWPFEEMSGMCRTCHDTHDAAASLVLERWSERAERRADPGSILCTDCHGDHRMLVRTIRWDRNTRELLDDF